MPFDVEDDLRSQTAHQLRQDRQSISSQLVHVQQQISDLAYGNYRTYADAGSTSEYCRNKFTEARSKVEAVDAEIAGLRGCLQEFSTSSSTISEQLHCIKAAESKSSPLWDILSLPARMDVCIRAGYYEVAYSLTNYGIQLQQHGLTKNPAIKAVADKLVDARHYLLDELFNRFAGPIDLASSIQVVNSIRKIPCLTPTQLRVSILQYRDLYLEKQIIDIRAQPDFILRMVEVYRDCMYDTMVLYLAVFPENEMLKRDASVDPRWDVWLPSGPSAVLSEWALHNVDVMFDYIRKVEDKSSVDVGVLSSKLMSFAMSFGRMGLDFRQLVANELHDLVVARFTANVSTAANRMAQLESLRIEGEVVEAVNITECAPGTQPPPPTVLSVWDDICVYGNDILDAINQLRNGLSPIIMGGVLEALSASLKEVFTWIDRFAERPDQQVQFEKGVRLLTQYLVPYLNRCLLVLFPYEKCCRPFFHTILTLELYEKRCSVKIDQLYAHCAHAAMMAQIAKPSEPLERVALNGHNATPDARDGEIVSGETVEGMGALHAEERQETSGQQARVLASEEVQTNAAVWNSTGDGEKHYGESGGELQPEAQSLQANVPDSAVSLDMDDEIDFTVPARGQKSEDQFSEITLKTD